MVDRKFRAVPFFTIVAAVGVIAVPFHLRPENFIVDDGYFYPQIARHIVMGDGSTFNGWTPTNGFHPLWMLVCIAAAWLTRAAETLVQILSVVQELLVVAALWLLVKIAQVEKKMGAVAGCAVLVFISVVLGIWRLLETDLALVLQMLALVVAVPVFPEVQQRLGRRRDLALGVLLGLTMLARLDLIFFVVTVLGYGLLHDDGRGLVERLRSVVVQGMVLSVVMAPYLGWNVMKFRHLLPISGAIKSSYPAMHFISFHERLVQVVLLIALLNALLMFKKRRDCFETLRMLTGTATVLVMVYTGLYALIWPWYLTTGFLCVALTAIWVGDRALGRVRQTVALERVIGAAALVVFFAGTALRSVGNLSYARLMQGTFSLRNAYREPRRALGLKLKAALPAGSRIFVYDSPGSVAFYSGLSVTPSDGLVSDYAYNEELGREGFVAFAAEHHLDYMNCPILKAGQIYGPWLFMTGVGGVGSQEMRVFVPLSQKDAGAVVLRDSDLVLRAPVTNPGFETIYPEVGVWRMEPPAF